MNFNARIAGAERASGNTYFDDMGILANANLLLVAGLETTVNLIGNGIMQLVHHRDQLEGPAEDMRLEECGG